MHTKFIATLNGGNNFETSWRGLTAIKASPHLFSGSSLLRVWPRSCCSLDERLPFIWNAPRFPQQLRSCFGLRTRDSPFNVLLCMRRMSLPLYGTSELITPSIPERANLFFRSAPTGFQVSPVGGAGANLLVMLQKVGALGSDLRGKKLVISLSPGWFLKVKSGQKGYQANFSPMAASKMIFDTALNFELKRDIASRMLKCPSTLEGRPLLKFAVRRLASGGWLDRIVFCALWPAGKLQNILLALQDHFAALNYIRDQIKPAPRPHPQVLDWSKLIAK